MDLVEEDEMAIAAAMVGEIMVAAMAAAMVEEIMVAAMAAMVEEIIVAAMAAAMVEEIMSLILIQINHQEQMVGKIEVMEILQKTLNMKVAEVEEKEEFQMRVIHQMRRFNDPFL